MKYTFETTETNSEQRFEKEQLGEAGFLIIEAGGSCR